MSETGIRWEVIFPLAKQLGVKQEALWKWRQRGSVPADWHLKLQAEARKSRKRLTAADLGVEVAV
jgi:hypothetical protein